MHACNELERSIATVLIDDEVLVFDVVTLALGDWQGGEDAGKKEGEEEVGVQENKKKELCLTLLH